MFVNYYILADPITAAAIAWYLVKMAIIMAISYAISRALQKKPPSIRVEPNQFNVPVIEEGSKLTVVFGTCWIENPLVAWWGDTLAQSAKLRIDDSGGQYMYFYNYYHGALHVICQGTCDGILQIKVGDNLVWPNPADKTEFAADAESSAVINLPDLYGGISTYHGNVTLGGGLVGTVDLEYGEPAQVINDYLQGVLGSYISANRGVTSAVLRQLYVGTDPNVQPWKYLAKRTAHLTTGETQWYAAKATIRNYEINPAHILRESFTDREWGLGESTGRFNDLVWKAFADALYDEGFGLCMKWESDQSLEDFIKQVLETIDAVIYQDYDTGEYIPVLIRDDYVIGELAEFDESDIVSIEEFSRGTIHKIPDVTFLKYWNIFDNLPILIPSHDVGLANSQNEMLIPNDVTFANVVNDNLGGQIAAREQRQLSSFPAIMEIKCKRTMSGLQPGDVFKMTYAPVGIISMVVRVLATNFGTIDDNEITLSCMEDIFGMKDSLYAAPPFSTWYNQPDAEAGSGIYDYPTIIYNRSTEEQIISRLTGNVIYKR